MALHSTWTEMDSFWLESDGLELAQWQFSSMQGFPTADPGMRSFRN